MKTDEIEEVFFLFPTGAFQTFLANQKDVGQAEKHRGCNVKNLFFVLRKLIERHLIEMTIDQNNN